VAGSVTAPSNAATRTIEFRTDDPLRCADSVILRDLSVGHLCARDVHCRHRRLAQRAFVNVANDADDLARRFLELRADAFADGDAGVA
jgi:hypothetical protein